MQVEPFEMQNNIITPFMIVINASGMSQPRPIFANS
jgi:hypothetical protein